MKALITFQSKNKYEFEGSRLRKLIKGALELNNVGYTSREGDEYDIVHIITPEEFNKIHDASSRGVPIVMSALMCEGDSDMSYLDFKFDDGKVTYTLKNKALKILNKVDHVIVPCERCKQYLIDEGVKTNISAIMPGVNLNRFDFNREDEKELFFRYFREDQTKKLVMSIGDCEHLYGVSSFIKAAEECEDVLFYFFLKGKINSVKPSRIKQIIKKAPKNVHFIEACNDDIYRSALINASIFMIPCYHQTSVVSILEAMAAKCEIIMRSQDLLPSILIDNETCHIAKFSETLTSLCVDAINGKLKSTITNAYEEANKYNLEIIGEQLKELYTSEINKNH